MINSARRNSILLKAMNDMHAERLAHEAVLEARIQSYELAFNMQTEAMTTFDVSKEPQNIREMYGDS